MSVRGSNDGLADPFAAFCALADQLLAGKETAEEIEAQARELAAGGRLIPCDWETLVRRARESVDRTPRRGQALARVLLWAASAQEDVLRRAQAGLLLAHACNQCRQCDEATALAQEALTVFQSLGDTGGVGRCELEMGVAGYLQGRHSEALRHLARARRLLAEAQAGSELARAHRWTAAVYADMNDLDEAAAWCRSALALCREHAAGTLERARCNLRWSLIAIYQTRYDEALALLRPLLPLLAHEGYSLDLAHGRKLMGLALTQQEAYDEAEESLLAAHHAYAAAGIDYEVGICERALAILYSKWDRLPQAMEHIRRALDIFEAQGHELGLARCMHTLGSLHFQSARYQESAEAYRRAVETFDACGLEIEAVVGRLNEAQALEQLGRYQEALSIYEQGRERLEQRGLDVYLANCLELLAAVHAHLGHRHRARRLYRRAKVLYEINGMAVSAAACQAALANL